MLLWQAVVLGLIQGLTEFIPISSTGHLTIAGKALGLIHPDSPERWTAFMAVIQLGTLAAVLTYFLSDIVAIVRGFLMTNLALAAGRTPSRADGDNAKLGWLIILGTTPTAVVGLLLKNVIEGGLTKNLWVIASSLTVIALLLGLAELVGTRKRELKMMRWTDALIFGVAQVFSLIPGSSRSGTTITAGLLAGLTRASAARFSFLLSIPAIAASGIFELPSALGAQDVGWTTLIAAVVAAGVFGYLSIAFLLRFLERHSTYVFVAYRIALGLVIVALLASGTVTPD